MIKLLSSWRQALSHAADTNILVSIDENLFVWHVYLLLYTTKFVPIEKWCLILLQTAIQYSEIKNSLFQKGMSKASLHIILLGCINILQDALANLTSIIAIHKRYSCHSLSKEKMLIIQAIRVITMILLNYLTH